MGITNNSLGQLNCPREFTHTIETVDTHGYSRIIFPYCIASICSVGNFKFGTAILEYNVSGQSEKDFSKGKSES